MNLDTLLSNLYTDDVIEVSLSPLEVALIASLLFLYLSPSLWDDYDTDGDIIDALVSEVFAKVTTV